MHCNPLRILCRTTPFPTSSGHVASYIVLLHASLPRPEHTLDSLPKSFHFLVINFVRFVRRYDYGSIQDVSCSYGARVEEGELAVDDFIRGTSSAQAEKGLSRRQKGDTFGNEADAEVKYKTMTWW